MRDARRLAEIEQLLLDPPRPLDELKTYLPTAINEQLLEAYRAFGEKNLSRLSLDTATKYKFLKGAFERIKRYFRDVVVNSGDEPGEMDLDDDDVDDTMDMDEHEPTMSTDGVDQANAVGDLLGPAHARR